MESETYRPKRILYQLLSPLHRVGSPEEVDRRREILQGWAGPAVEIAIASPDAGPDSIASEADISEAYLAVREEAPHWRARGYQAAVLGCFSDPSMAALREMSGIPVIGPGAAAMFFASQIADGFSILSSDPSPGGLFRRIKGMGLADFFRSERRVPATVAELRSQDPAIVARVCEEAGKCVADGAEAIILGCLAMSFTPGLPKRIQAAAGVPVINPVIAALKTAEIAIAAHAVNQGKD